MNPFITDDVRITDIRPLISPAILMQDFPASHEVGKVVYDAREEFQRILKKEDSLTSFEKRYRTLSSSKRG